MKLQYITLLAVTLLCFHVYNVQCTRDCKTTEDYASEAPFLQFFDECFLDTTTVNAWASIATQFQSWFNIDSYPVYIMVAIFVISLMFFSDTLSPDDAAKGNCIRLQAIVMLTRIGLVISMIPWLWAALTQERPCVCRVDSNHDYQQIFPMWGMPSGSSFFGHCYRPSIWTVHEYSAWDNICLTGLRFLSCHW